jgi:hypothetical protein
MTKELSIETIKEELIDKLMNDEEVLKYLEADKWMKDKNTNKIEDIYNALIFNYRASGWFDDNYIFVEINEQENYKYTSGKTILYTVMIGFSLMHKENLDKLSTIIKKIVCETYGDLKKQYSNIAYDGCMRVISFNIEVGETTAYRTKKYGFHKIVE